MSDEKLAPCPICGGACHVIGDYADCVECNAPNCNYFVTRNYHAEIIAALAYYRAMHSAGDAIDMCTKDKTCCDAPQHDDKPCEYTKHCNELSVAYKYYIDHKDRRCENCVLGTYCRIRETAAVIEGVINRFYCNLWTRKEAL